MSEALKARIDSQGLRWHDLKVWPRYFEKMRAGVKPFEVRKDDRGFGVGDILELREWDPETEAYTGQRIIRRITYILTGGQFGIEAGYAALAIDTI